MKLQKLARASVALLGTACLSTALTGCQTTVGGQTLPSAYFLIDDVQYFPGGPEYILSNTVRAQENYKLDQAGFQADFGGADDGFGLNAGPGGAGGGAGGLDGGYDEAMP